MKGVLLSLIGWLFLLPLWGHEMDQVRAEIELGEREWVATLWIEAWVFYPEEGPLAVPEDPRLPGKSGARWMETLDAEAWGLMKAAAEEEMEAFFLPTMAGAPMDFEVSFPDLEELPWEFEENEDHNSLLRVRLTGEFLDGETGSFGLVWEEPDEVALVITVKADGQILGVRHVNAGRKPKEIFVRFGEEGNAEIEVADSSLLDWVKAGFVHILPKGLDHILFILGLFLLQPKLKPLLYQTSAFTLAHSITLALVVLGTITVPSRFVEAMIALSIAYVGFENLWMKELKARRVVFVFALGLLHGMGFASVMQELNLPSGSLLQPLIGFNLGVEAGQLTVLVAAFLLTFWAFKKAGFELFRKAASLAIALVGVYWTVERLMG